METEYIILLLISLLIGVMIGISINELGHKTEVKYIKFKGRLVRVFPKRGFKVIPGGKGGNKNK